VPNEIDTQSLTLRRHNKGNVFPVQATKAYEEYRIAPLILNLDTRWRLVASVTSRSL